MKRSEEHPDGRHGAFAAAGAMALVAVCCGAHLLLLGALGGLAVGSMPGVGAGALAAVLVVVAAVVSVRRRRASACEAHGDARLLR